MVQLQKIVNLTIQNHNQMEWVSSSYRNEAKDGKEAHFVGGKAAYHLLYCISKLITYNCCNSNIFCTYMIL